MKKKKVLSLLLALSLCVGLFTVPAGAEALPNSVVKSGSGIYYDQDDYEFWYTYESRLFRGMNELYTVTPVHQYPQTFHSGMKFLGNNSSDKNSFYLTEDGRVVDLNRGRFFEMGPFSEGLAPFFVEGKVLESWGETYEDMVKETFCRGYTIYEDGFYYGYVNTDGVVVIPPIFGKYRLWFQTKEVPGKQDPEYFSYRTGGWFAGKFIGGKAMIPGYFELGRENREYSLKTFVPELKINNFAYEYDNSYDESWWDYFYRQGGASKAEKVLGYIFIDKTGQWTGEYGIFDSYDDWVAGISMYIYNEYGLSPDIMFQEPVKIISPDPEVEYVPWYGAHVDWDTVSEFDLGDYTPNVPQESASPAPVIPQPTPTPEPQPEGQVTSDGIRVLIQRNVFNESAPDKWNTDVGAYCEISFTNTTDHPIQGNYGLLSYYPKKSRTIYKQDEALIRDETSCNAQFMFFDLNLAPGENKTIHQNSGLTLAPRFHTQTGWVRFDSEEEKDQFIATSPFASAVTLDYNYAYVTGSEGETFLQDNFGITFLPPDSETTRIITFSNK